MRRYLVAGLVVLFWCLTLSPCVFAGGHYLGGVANVRDFVQPFDKGLAVVGYNPFYHSDEYRNDNGDKVSSISGSRTVEIAPQLIVEVSAAINNIDLDIKSYTFNPLFFYFTGIDILGANYGVGIGPSYNDVHVKFSADLTGDVRINDRVYSGGTSVDLKDSASGFGDMMVRPVMLDWSTDRYDIVAAYSFYAPTGAYDSEDLANPGYGYWSHELSLGGLLYFNKKATALLCNATYEINTTQDDTDVKQGQNLIMEYGISQYLATWFEVGVSGASYFQMTDKKGMAFGDENNKTVQHTAAAEMTVWPVPQKVGVVGRYFNQYYAKNSVRGQGANVTVFILF